ncbi:hypothetical protein LGL08_22150 [Clostridium estertheticum]|uniref:hypothetical protein n=1 Tax=Clostridium estertheticum TaxID=238834 RepID=UPI001CF43187|nr:hypothetical protein [Clostridium estertheticum]MCB2309261.1 hypothetical protein [Clostridium estertheticum]MCB2346794.1 hypothetical protein [Clostridium estertheticum]MCB2352228.1 hypothetical protein [Clostridium estertheticum]WAG48533.1 hypothetical protein LL127_23650 [Clostridium estertheticum]
MEQYIVYVPYFETTNGDFDKNLFKIIAADSEDEAISKFMINLVTSKKSLSFDLLSNDDFYGQYYNNNSKVPKMYKGKNTDKLIENNIRKFFKGTDFAEIFLENYNNSKTEDAILPTELLLYYVTKTNYFGNVIIKNIKEIII